VCVDEIGFSPIFIFKSTIFNNKQQEELNAKPITNLGAVLPKSLFVCVLNNLTLDLTLSSNLHRAKVKQLIN